MVLSIRTCLQTPGLNVITEYCMGLILPGKPIANVCFKVYGYMSMNQSVSFLTDFKLGHYMKIPPRSMFLVQVHLALDLSLWSILIKQARKLSVLFDKYITHASLI